MLTTPKFTTSVHQASLVISRASCVLVSKTLPSGCAPTVYSWTQPRLRSCGAAHSVGSINYQVCHFSSAAAPSVHQTSFETWGVWIGNALAMSTHIIKAVASCFATLRQLRSVRRSLSHESFTRLVFALVLARLDYCNSPGWTSCQSTQPTAVRSPCGSTTDLRRPSIRPRYTTAAAVALVVSARTSDIQTVRHGVSLSAWYRPWILLGGLQARVRDLLSPATAFGLQYRRRGSCHTPVFTWRPRIPGRRSSSVERATVQCHLCTIFVLIPATFFFSSDNGVNNTNYCAVVLKCLALSTTLILANWTELNWTDPEFKVTIFFGTEYCISAAVRDRTVVTVAHQYEVIGSLSNGDISVTFMDP